MKKILKITDLSYDFLPHPVTGNILFVKNEQAIKQSTKQADDKLSKKVSASKLQTLQPTISVE